MASTGEYKAPRGLASSTHLGGLAIMELNGDKTIETDANE